VSTAGFPRQGSRIGNVRVRLARRRRTMFTVVQRRKPRNAIPPSSWLPLGFLVVILLGTALLMLPVASADRTVTNPVTALFTSTSAVSTTGLVVVDTADQWSVFGEGVVLALIQFGGFGFMLTATLLLLALRRRLTYDQRLVTAQTMAGASDGSTPVARVVRRVAVVTLLIEAVGFAVLAPIIIASASSGELAADLWRSLFTTVSAFNTAGFDIEGGFSGLAAERANVLLLATTLVLAIVGAAGYAIWSDLWRVRRGGRLAVETRLFIVTVAVLWTGAFAAVLVIETGFGSDVGPEGLAQQSLDSAYTVLSAGTTVGFAQESMDALRDASKGVLLGLMFIGGASGSTAGGIKVTTWAVLLLAVLASARGEERVNAFEREIAWPIVHRALSVALLSVAVVFAVTILVSATTDADFVRVVFEGVSAFGTVGLSTGITPDLSTPSRLFIIVVMFIGRVGPLTLALSLAAHQPPARYRFPTEAVSIG
jgi:trk system potassium uptake protein TrkH